MNDYKELICSLRGKSKLEAYYTHTNKENTVEYEAADAIEQLVKERDAAIATIPHKCWSCGKGFYGENGFDCEETHYRGNNPNCLSWEWRGVQ